MSRFLTAVIIILILGIVALGLLVRFQNLSIAELQQSVTTLSSSVFDIVKQKEAKLVNTGERMAAKMSNPASQNCVGLGGKLAIEKRPDGGEYGVCGFDGGLACEEWALFRGDCPQGGVDLSAALNPADRFCLLTGHRLAKPGTAEKAGSCEVDKQACSSQELYETGDCKYSMQQGSGEPMEAPLVGATRVTK